MPASQIAEEFHPPEWKRNEDDPQAAAVYCLGAGRKIETTIINAWFNIQITVMRAAGVEQAEDVDLFSLVNIMTVSMISTRPTPHR